MARSAVCVPGQPLLGGQRMPSQLRWLTPPPPPPQPLPRNDARCSMELACYLVWLACFTAFTLIFQFEDWSLSFRGMMMNRSAPPLLGAGG